MIAGIFFLMSTSAMAAGPVPFKEPASGIELVPVKGGCFKMGNDYGIYDTWDEQPEHEVCLSDFHLGTFEVTQKQWQAVMGNNPGKLLQQ